MAARRKLHLATLMFGVARFHQPKYLYDRLSWRRYNEKILIRASASVLRIPIHNTAAFRGSFKYAATHCWNDIPPPIRSLNTRNIFKHHLKVFLFNEQKISNY